MSSRGGRSATYSWRFCHIESAEYLSKNVSEVNAMRFPLRTTLAVLTGALAVTSHMILATTITGLQNGGSLRAKQMWEEAIAAKGGRERLHGVKTLLVSSVSKYHKAPKGISGDHTESLYVLPDKWWEWIDSRPGSFGLSTLTFDFGKPVGWEIYTGLSSAQPISTKRDTPRPDDPYQIHDPSAGVKFANKRNEFTERQVLYLMETRCTAPTPLKVRTASIRGTELDVIETRIGNERVDFYLDRGTHLAVRVIFTTRIESTGRDYVEVIELGDYTNVDGIQMPRGVSWARDEENRTSYQINVDYDLGIFEHPPTIDMDPEAWKKGYKPSSNRP